MLKAVQRTTNAVYRLKRVVETIDKESDVTAESRKHTHTSPTKIVEEIIKVLKGNPGRSPLDSVNVTVLCKWLTHNTKRLFANAFAPSDDVEDDETTEQHNESDSENL